MSLKEADRGIADVLAFFGKAGLEVGLLVPTTTGLGKSIMDAHAPLRDYLATKGVHQYDAQGQGQAHKKVIVAHFVCKDRLVDTTASLYRPETKAGDPRIWFSKLRDYASPRNLLAIIVDAGALYVVNTSLPGLLETGDDASTPLGALIARLVARDSGAISELIEKLREIGRLGYVPTMRSGPTGVGYTLESLLGIAANVQKTPDFKGIEIKSGRTRDGGASTSRMTIFSKSPDWQLSRVKSGVELVQRYGYVEKGRHQLYCSLVNQPNTLGLFLSVESATDVLHSEHRADGRPDEKVVQWSLPGLRSALQTKHPETCVVKAATRKSPGGVEEFHYRRATYTRKPLIANLSALLETGYVGVDFLVHLKESSSGQPRARDHGYLFKIHEKDAHLLFPSPAVYPLA